MRIAFLKNPANIAWRLAEGMRKLGYEAVVYSRYSPYGFPFDRPMPEGPEWNLWLLRELPRLRKFDALHVVGGIWRGEVAYKALAPLLPPIFVQYNGGEARNGGGLHWQGVAKGFFYVDQDIRSLVPEGAVHLPQPIDTETMPNVSTTGSDERTVFAHFPTGEKGTDRIVEMFESAFGRGGTTEAFARRCQLRIFDDVTHAKALREMMVSDVVIDQLTDLGIYGYVAVEAMAMGKPAMSSIRREYYPSDCPVIYPRAVAMMELTRPENRKWYGEAGRRYVERVHDSKIVAQTALDAYEAAL